MHKGHFQSVMAHPWTWDSLVVKVADGDDEFLMTVIVNVANGRSGEDMGVNVDVVVPPTHMMQSLLKLLILPHAVPEDKVGREKKRVRGVDVSWDKMREGSI